MKFKWQRDLSSYYYSEFGDKGHVTVGYVDKERWFYRLFFGDTHHYKRGFKTIEEAQRAAEQKIRENKGLIDIHWIEDIEYECAVFDGLFWLVFKQNKDDFKWEYNIIGIEDIIKEKDFEIYEEAKEAVELKAIEIIEKGLKELEWDK